MRSNRGPIIASELHAQLEADAEWVKRRDERSRVFAERARRLREAELPLVAELEHAGFKVRSVWDFVNTSASYPGAIPILLRHLKLPYLFPIREGIARALTVKEARNSPWNVYRALVDEYVRQPGLSQAARNELGKAHPGSEEVLQQEFKWALGNAIWMVATKKNFEEVAGLVQDTRHGHARDRMAFCLPRLDRNRAWDVLVPLLDDPDIDYAVTRALFNLRDRRLLPLMDRFLHSKDSEIRRRAEKLYHKLTEQE